MTDWDEDGSRLQDNLEKVFLSAEEHAKTRGNPSVDVARGWHRQIMDGLKVPDEKYVGHFRGEPGLEGLGVKIGDAFGTAAPDVAEEIEKFENQLSSFIIAFDEWIQKGERPDDSETLDAVLALMSWVHGEWARIHPFANGNGRIARLWSNWVAMRYGLPGFVRLRPRPSGDLYSSAAAKSMNGQHEEMKVVFRSMLEEFLKEP